jgi:hypothetical protein
MAISGQKTIATAGTELALAAVGTYANCAVAVKALPANTGVMYVGWTTPGVVSATTGFPLSAGQTIIFDHVSDLGFIMVDASVSGESVAWLILGGI